MPYKNPKQQAAIAISMKKAGKTPKEIAKHMNKGGKATKSKVNESGNYTKPTMRKRLFEKIKAGSKGGKPGQWSARKAQMLAREYKAAGGGYK
jgi:isopropylmalate/homocitrate/citramalate synthase